MGYPETGDGARADEKTALSILDRAVELGVTFWDTANRYNASSGNSERVIGTWMKHNADQRRNVVLATKLFGLMDGRSPNHCRLSRANILDSAYASLERLQVDYVDLLYFHGFDPLTPIEESLAAVEDLVRRDQVRYLGVSNFTADQLSLYHTAQRNSSIRCQMVAVQNQFDVLLGETHLPPGALEYAARTGISFVAWSPLARGLLTERYLDLDRVGPGDRLYDEGAWEELATKETMAKLHQLTDLAHEWGCTLNQLVIAYMLTLPGMGPVIASASSVEQLESNAPAGKMILTDRQIFEIAKVLRGSDDTTLE
jgi:aryl-alcohol dehydrogenase-like predicted oxidoreductase